MGAAHDLEASVTDGGRIHGNHAAHEIGEEAA
jgi:hypothetical protein